MISASLVKELREKTGAGMMDCKRALEATDGDIEKAVDWLREQGIAKSVKKSGRIAAEGLTKVKTLGNKAVIVEVNSETDFVAKNDQFIALIDQTLDAILENSPKSVEEALNISINGSSLNDLIVEATATIGEKISLRRFELVEKSDTQLFGSYIHMGGNISSLVVLDGTDENVAKDMAMQVASMAPQYVSQADMPSDVVEHETTVQRALMANDDSLAGKPEKVLENILRGKVSKSLQDISLEDQIFFKDQAIKCKEYLNQHKSKVVSFVRYQVGEGIEKREENFAEEVKKQMGN